MAFSRSPRPSLYARTMPSPHEAAAMTRDGMRSALKPALHERMSKAKGIVRVMKSRANSTGPFPPRSLRSAVSAMALPPERPRVNQRPGKGSPGRGDDDSQQGGGGRARSYTRLV